MVRLTARFRSIVAARAAAYVAVFLSAALCGRSALASAPARVSTFLKQHCLDCHEGEGAEAALDLTALQESLDDPAAEQKWVRIFDRVHDGEMPPPDSYEVKPAERAEFTKSLGNWIRDVQTARHEELGRVRARRLTRREVERTLHDLLGIDIPLAWQLPEEAKTAGFTTVADGQSMSHFQLERHLTVVDLALDEAFRRALTPEDRFELDLDAEGVARKNPRSRNRDPELRKGQAVVWSSGLIYYGRISATTAPEDGWYRFKVRVSSLKPPESGGVWTTVKTGLCVSSAPLLTHVTTFEAEPEPKDVEFVAWLPRRHMIEIRPGDTTLKKGRFEGGQVGTGEGEDQDLPGIAIDRLTMERIHLGPCDDEVRDLLLGDLRIEPQKKGLHRVVSETPKADIERLLTAFARRAFRRPVTSGDVQRYVELSQAAFDDGDSLVDALRVGYRALLCSPRFLYLSEEPGRLDDHAIAARLSYFLTGSTPDATLSKLADEGRLQDPGVIREQTDRLLAGEGGRQFLQDFAAEWLDLDQIDFTTPDTRMFREFDSVVQSSMLDETHQFLETMLRKNLSVSHLIDANFTYLNSRLARFYGIEGVEGDDLEQVSLSPETHRGGLLTHGSILKVTANGSTTSPVVRGVWVSERLLGEPIPPPPASVPAIEPDIRGATTIREQLQKHLSDASCASCHVKIDPPGFALENFDPAGQWRDRYVQLVKGRRSGGPKIESGYVLPDGREFESIDDFRRLVAARPHKLAENVAEKLLVYGTGAPISFADRDTVEQIADDVQADDYGLRSILYAVVASPAFLSK